MIRVVRRVELVDAALRLLDEEAQFRAAGLEGGAYADRGEFIEDEVMDARFEHVFAQRDHKDQRQG